MNSCSRVLGPGDGLFEPIITRERFPIGGAKHRRAEDPKTLGFRCLCAQPILVGLTVRCSENSGGIKA